MELTSEQIKVVSGIFANLGHIFFASIVIPFILGPPKTHVDIWLVLFGVSAALSLWSVGILFSGKINS